MNANSVTVKGLAETEVKADLAIWSLQFVATGNDLAGNSRPDGKQAQMIVDFLNRHKFAKRRDHAGADHYQRPFGQSLPKCCGNRQPPFYSDADG